MGLAGFGLLGVALGLSAPLRAADADPAPLAVQVNEAIDRGVVFLRGLQEEDGSYRGDAARYFRLGLTGFVVHALVKSGVSPTEPDLVRAADFLTSRPAKSTYAAAFVILGLDAVKDASKYPVLRETAEWLLRVEWKGKGLWGYPAPPADLSNTQLALLALAAAERRGVETPGAVYKATIRSLGAFRRRGDGYAYRAPPAAGLPTGSMTTAALTILHLAERGLGKTGGSRVLRKRAAKLADEAWAWMDRRFCSVANPIGGHFATTTHTLYYLYGVERAAALGDRRRIGGHDWYREGARFLVGTQEEDGSWGSTADTCFALLFLRRATFTGLGRTVEPLEGEGVAGQGGGAADASSDPAGPVDPGRGVVPFSRWLSLGPFPDPGDADAPAVPVEETDLRPREGRRVRGRAWQRVVAGPSGIDLPWEGGDPAHRLGYLGAWLHVRADVDVVLWIEQRGGVSVRVGGRTVFERRIDGDDRTTPVPLRLEEGVVPLLLRWESWEAAAHLHVKLATPGGFDASEVRWSLSEKGPDTRADLQSRPSVVGWAELLATLDPDGGRDALVLDFDDPLDLERVCLLAEGRVWRSATKTRPLDGATADLSASGLLEAQPGPGSYVTLVRKVPAPAAGARIVARVAVIGPTRRDPNRRFVARIGVYDGATTLLAEAPVKNAAAASLDPWATIEGRVPPTQGAEVLLFLVVRAESGAFTGSDRLYVDEFSVR